MGTKINPPNANLDAFPPRPKMPFGQQHVAINIYNICKWHFGLGGESI